MEQDNKGRESVRFCLNILKFGVYRWHRNKSVQTGEKISAAIFWIWVGVATLCWKTENSIRPSRAFIPKLLVRLRGSGCTPVLEAVHPGKAGCAVPEFGCSKRQRIAIRKLVFFELFSLCLGIIVCIVLNPLFS